MAEAFNWDDADNAVEPELIGVDAEGNFQSVEAQFKVNGVPEVVGSDDPNKRNIWLEILCEAIDYPNSPTVVHRLFIPNKEIQKAKTYNTFLLRIKRFRESLGWTPETPAVLGAQYPDLENAVFNAKVGLEKGKDGFDDKNQLRRFQAA